MNVFKIESIEYGWFNIRIGKCYIECSDYLSCDSPKMFLRAIISLANNDTKEEWLCWQNEPGAEIMHLKKENDNLKIQLFGATTDSFELELTGKELKCYCGESRGNFDVKLLALIDDILVEFSLYEKGNGLLLYSKHWEDFPQREFDSLKAIAHILVKKEKEDLFIDTY